MFWKRINIKKTAIVAVVFSLGFVSAFYVQKYKYERKIMEAYTWPIYNALSLTMGKLLSDARSCKYNPDMDIWYIILNESAKYLYTWHMERIADVDLIDTADYVESHRSAKKHALGYIKAIEEMYAGCEFPPLEKESN